MAYLTWQRRSKNPTTLLQVQLADPADHKSPFVVMRQGKRSEPMRTTKEVQRYIRRFYENLLYNESGAPDDIFLDSMKAISKKR